jgi:hypothetical protein
VNNTKHEITLLSHIKQIRLIPYSIILGGSGIAIATHELNVPIHVRVLLPIILGLVFGLDAIVLHIRYWILNRNTVLKISDECIEVSISGNATEIKPDDIDSFELNLTRPFFDNGPVWGPGEDYLYAFIRLKSGEEFVITSLLLAKLKFPEAFLDQSTKIQRLRAWPK